MKVTFPNGAILACNPPSEHTVFNAEGKRGWLCTFGITAEMTSSDAENLITVDNISNLLFSSEEVEKSFTIAGYTKINSIVIRYGTTGMVTEIQISKGI